MEKEKKASKVKNVLVITACSVMLFVAISAAVVKGTFLRENFLLNQIEKTRYSELVIKEASKNFREENREKNKFTEVIATAISPKLMKQILQAYIRHTYNKREYPIDKSKEINKEITEAIDKYAQKHQLTISNEEQKEIETMKFNFLHQLQDATGNRYLDIFIGNIQSAKKRVRFAFYIGTFLFALLLFYLFLLVRKLGYLLLRYGAFILGISGSMFLLLAGLLNMRNFLEKIAFPSQAISKLMQSYVQEFLTHLVLVGVILLISAGVFGVIGEFIRKEVNKIEILKIHS
ncbi:hypothetical protein AALA44_05745 [Enterococcus ratti]|uniref:hypothetical protein n=1 Tax=Enterococcus ratti TaxID=150033 RepID=UPI003512DA36